MYDRFRESYYNTPTDPNVGRSIYAGNYPLIVGDCSRQNKSIKEGIADIKLDIKTGERVPENTTGFCLIIHDQKF